MNALDLALANAAANAPKGEELHLENLDSIADPTQDEFTAFDNELKEGSQSAANQEAAYRLNMESKYPDGKGFRPSELLEPSHTDISYISIDHKLNQLLSHSKSQSELTRLRLNGIADMITEISTTINTAASMSSEPNHKHRSLHEWDDSSLLNELVERENDLMPFYYELLKRIGSPELQSLVMSSMQGKNNSMVTLAQLCAAMSSMTVQPRPQYHESTAQEYPSTVMSRVPPQQTAPQQQYFGQATEEYIRQTNNR